VTNDSSVLPPAPFRLLLRVANDAQALLRKQNTQLAATLADAERTLAAAVSRLREPKGMGEDTVRQHIRLLHEYNEVKDVAMGLLGLVADARGVAVGAVMREMGIEGDGE